jgi:hypothetical protein
VIKRVRFIFLTLFYYIIFNLNLLLNNK